MAIDGSPRLARLPSPGAVRTRLMNSLCCRCCCARHAGRGGFEFRSEGVHLINDPFYSVDHNSAPYGTGTFIHGDRTLVVVEQGNIGFAMDRGQPVLLPP
eukprot:SAG22_NODE_5284_length_1046_cov_1.050686_1_plen_99_part_10